MDNLEARTVEIARTKLETGASGEKIHRPRLGTGGNFADVFFWDTAFTVLWAKYYRDTLPVTTSLDNLYRLQDESGLINRQYLPTGEPKWSAEHPISIAPPVLSWAELDLYQLTGDAGRLEEVVEPLVRHHEYIARTLRAADGLYFSDALGCGMDNLPRWHRDWEDAGDGMRLEEHHIKGETHGIHRNPALRWNRQGRWIDLSAQMAFDAWCLAEIAALIGRHREHERRRAEHHELSGLINERMWNERLGFYVDLGYDRQIDRLHIGGFWPLIARIVPADRVARVAAHLEDEQTFGTPVPVPTLARSDPDFDRDGGYWRGASWAPTTYMVLRGLDACGARALAARLARRALDAVIAVHEQTGTIWENYAPTEPAPGRPAQPDFCGWSGLYTVAIPRELMIDR
jgi:hypothetical protein